MSGERRGSTFATQRPATPTRSGVQWVLGLVAVLAVAVGCGACASTRADPRPPEDDLDSNMETSPSDAAPAAGAAKDSEDGDATPPPRGAAEAVEAADVADASAEAGGPSPGTQAGPSLTKEEIREAVRARFPQIRDCYNRALARDVNCQGTVKVQFVISPDGTVAQAVVASLEGDVDDTELHSCLLDEVKLLVVSSSREGGRTIVTYPFKFSPG